jgi:hypothetical protein
MPPENNTGKDVEITERTQALKGTKQYRTPNNKMRISKATLDNHPTNKVDPTTGSTRRENRDRKGTRNPVGKPEIPLTTSSISKSNGSKHSRLTKGKEQDDTKQADKINPSELSLMHNKQGPSPRNYPETIHHGDHAGRYKPQFNSPERNDNTHDTDYHSSHNYDTDYHSPHDYRIHHNTTSESRETRNPNTKSKSETSNQQHGTLLLWITTATPFAKGSTLEWDLETPPHEDTYLSTAPRLWPSWEP